jgi:hypothetical protein
MNIKMDKVKLEKINDILDSMNNTRATKHIKRESGLIERVELNKVVLTEDNKMLLND